MEDEKIVPTGTENPDDSQPAPEENQEKKPEDDATPSPEDKQEAPKVLAFHEDPKVQEYIDRQMTAREAKMKEEWQKDFEARINKPKDNTDEEIPEWFGGDAKQWQSFLAHQEKIIEKARKGAVEEFQNGLKAEDNKVKEANDWFEQSVTTIEGLTGKKVDRNALLAYTLEKQYIDGSRRWDYFKAAKEMFGAAAVPPKDDKKPALDERKKLADATTKDTGKSEPSTKAFKTNEDFKKEKPW